MPTPKLLSLVSFLLLSTSALAATDPCAPTFEKIATALEQGQAGIALGYFTGTDRGAQIIRDAVAVPAAAARLAAVFRTATLKTAFDSTAIYSASWEASLGHVYAIDIGATVSLTGCTVQAW